MMKGFSEKHEASQRIYLRDITEQKSFIAISYDLVVGPMKFGSSLRLSLKLKFDSDLPSSGPLRTIKFNYASRNKEQALWGIMCIDDLAFFVYNQAIKHVDVSLTKNEEAS